MNRKTNAFVRVAPLRLAAVALTLGVATVAPGQKFQIDWHSIDGGGVMFSTGGGFELGGALGQPDAGLLTGGNFELTGGFWAGAVPQCALPGPRA